jgi:hypothetical protein
MIVGKGLSLGLHVIMTIPHVGAFYGARIVLLLQDLGLLDDTDEPLLDPGSTEAIKWLFQNGSKKLDVRQAFEKLYLDFNDLLPSKETLENALSKFHKYCQAFSNK